MKLKFNDDTELKMTTFQDIESGGIKATLETEFATVQALTSDQLSKVYLIGDEGATYNQFNNLEINSISLDMASKLVTVELVSKSLKEQIVELKNQVKELQDALSEQQTQIATISNGVQND